jgi:hypothetical protein
LDWLGLSQIIKNRLVSRGGRPSDPRWEIQRLVPFRTETWKRLTEEARTMRSQGRKVGPAQLAALLIDNGVSSVPQSEARRQAVFEGAVGEQRWSNYPAASTIENNALFEFSAVAPAPEPERPTAAAPWTTVDANPGISLQISC